MMDQDYLKTDFLNELTPIALFNLRRTNQHFNTRITDVMIVKNIAKQIILRLKHIFGDKLSEFKQILQETKAVITGSFIIQCVLDVYWKDSDIDIFIPTYGNKINKT